MQCPKCPSRLIIKKGRIKTRKKGKKTQRFQCKSCKTLFTKRNFFNKYREKKPELDLKVQKLYLEGMSFRGIARFLKCDYKTVVRKFEKLSKIAKWENYQANLSNTNKLKTIQIGEMPSYIQSKSRPIYIALALSNQGQILSSKVRENREENLNNTLKDIINYVSDESIFYFNSKKYLPFVEKRFPNTDYVICKGRDSSSYLSQLNFTCRLIKSRLARMGNNKWSFNQKTENLQLSLELLQFSFNQKFKQSKKIIKIAEWIKEPFDLLSEQISETKKAG